ncbi:hypothetical protein FJT64_005332 [Amphibalanus amphitrite]|uniref:Uncharacterized protein n=1 Tax=Amphibalanus amphitrite TaxID=1232801 RepID=A0A6A4VRF4_AMPAM|nr:hypothetical protein FJT64_005332 [Amphibalanus amphitrite]
MLLTSVCCTPEEGPRLLAQRNGWSAAAGRPDSTSEENRPAAALVLTSAEDLQALLVLTSVEDRQALLVLTSAEDRQALLVLTSAEDRQALLV